MARAAKAADHLDAGTYITDETRLMRVLADTNGGIEAEDQRTGAIVCLTMGTVLREWRVVIAAVNEGSGQ